MSEKVSLPRRLLNAWMMIVARFGEVQTLVLLGLFYAFLIGPISLFMAVARQDLLHKRGLGEPGTAWDEAESAPADLERARLQS